MIANKQVSIRIYEYIARNEYAKSVRRKFLKPIAPIILKDAFPVSILFIFGFQRSGTTALLHNIRGNFGFTIFNEFSPLSDKGEEKLRFNPIGEVQRIIHDVDTPYVAVKPLVESQQADYILEQFPRAKGVWLYRNYKDVIRSFNKRFGADSNRLALERIAEGHNTNWRTERIPDELREVARTYINSELTDIEITALFWYIRNSLYFHHQFDKINNLFLMRYESWVKAPTESLRKLFNYIDYPEHFTITEPNFHQKSINLGTDLDIRPEIDTLCQNMLNQLDEMFYRQKQFV